MVNKSTLTNVRNFHVSQLANKTLRAFNFLIDIFLVSALHYLFIVTYNSFNNDTFTNYDDLTPSFIIFLAYYVLFEYFKGKTIGKYITKTIVLTDGGLKPTFVNIVGRSLIRLIPLEPLSCLLNTKAYGWHDSFSKTIVIPEDIIKASANVDYYFLGLKKFDSENYDEAIKAFSLAINSDPQHKDAYYKRGVAKFILEKYNDSIIDFTKALEINPEFAMGYYNRGFAYLIIQQKEDACKDFKKASNLGYAKANEAVIENCI